jgi:hypothetical protein
METMGQEGRNLSHPGGWRAPPQFRRVPGESEPVEMRRRIPFRNSPTGSRTVSQTKSRAGATTRRQRTTVTSAHRAEASLRPSASLH